MRKRQNNFAHKVRSFLMQVISLHKIANHHLFSQIFAHIRLLLVYRPHLILIEACRKVYHNHKLWQYQGSLNHRRRPFNSVF